MKTVERNFFPKNERLYLQNDIDMLFTKGRSFVCYPFRIVYLLITENDSTHSDIALLVSIPKKHIKLAVKRNRIKRFVRESFRLNKNTIINHFKMIEKHLHIAFLYTTKEMKTYAEIEKTMQKALEMIRNQLI